MAHAFPISVTLLSLFGPDRLARLDVAALEQRCLDSLLEQLGSAEAVAQLALEAVCYEEQPDSGLSRPPEPAGLAPPTQRYQTALGISTQYAFGRRRPAYGLEFDLAVDPAYAPPPGARRGR